MSIKISLVNWSLLMILYDDAHYIYFFFHQHYSINILCNLSWTKKTPGALQLSDAEPSRHSSKQAIPTKTGRGSQTRFRISKWRTDTLEQGCRIPFSKGQIQTGFMFSQAEIGLHKRVRLRSTLFIPLGKLNASGQEFSTW